MKVRVLLLFLFVAGVGAFAAANWAHFTAPTSLSLVVTTVYAPLGIIMLCLTGAAVILALVLSAHLKTTMLLESRSHSREMQVQRKLADATEASRLTELQRAIELALQRNAQLTTDSRLALNQRIELAEANICASVEQGGNTLGAYIGELEDRLEQRSGNARQHGA
ncbi:MAG: hypothetical protein NVSMB6_03920 [Burkholderiaceae bacterium]